MWVFVALIVTVRQQSTASSSACLLICTTDLCQLCRTREPITFTNGGKIYIYIYLFSHTGACTTQWNVYFNTWNKHFYISEDYDNPLPSILHPLFVSVSAWGMKNRISPFFPLYNRFNLGGLNALGILKGSNIMFYMEQYISSSVQATRATVCCCDRSPLRTCI